MTVLIAKQNEEIIKRFLPKARFVESTKNTSTFSVGRKTLEYLIGQVRMSGFNPFALMYW